MRILGTFCLLAVICAILQITSGFPIFSNKIRALKCSPVCPESRNFKYSKGMSYRFAYSMEASTEMGGATKEGSRLSVTSDVKIDVLGRCEMALRLHNTQLHVSNERGIMKKAKKEELNAFKLAVREYPLRFSFQDGVVKHLCLEAGNSDPPWVLNFKRGIISVFQSGMEDWTQSQNVSETDIVGECPTQYKVLRKTSRSIQVSKVKDIASCRQRHNSKRTLFSVPYGMESASPILSTDYGCDQSLSKAGHLQESHCTEKHVFRPLTRGNAEVSSTIKQSLFFIKKRREGKKYRTRIVLRQPMTFDHNNDEVKPVGGRYKTEKILRDLCKSTELGIKTKTPRLFSHLVSTMKILDRTDLERVYYLLKTNDICSTNVRTLQFFLDALPATATRGALKLMTSLLTSGEVKGVGATLWMTSIGFIAAPTAAMLKEVKPLMEHKRTRSRAVLPVSSLVHNFCLHHVTQCSHQRVVTDILTSIQARLGHWCDARGRKQDQVLLSLRALGNLGHLAQAVPIINKCLIRASNPLGVRIAAAESFRRMPCEKQRRHRRYLWQLFTSSTIDPELRIASYLSMMRCADQSFMTDIIGRVNKMASREEEGVTRNDVRSDAEVKAFVYTHLINVQESSSPHKQALADVIKRYKLKQGEELNRLNLSKSVEFSSLDKQLNLGYTAEGNVLCSGKDQLPRAVSANLTLDLFGNSFNFLDFGARVVELEDHLATIRDRYRQEKLSFWLKRHMPKEVEGHGYLRVFGNEILFLRMSDLAAIFDGDKSELLPLSLDDLLTRMSGDHDKSLTWAVPLVDASTIIPTASGFPIRLEANGSAVVDLGFKGVVDLRKVNSRSRSLNIEGELRARSTMEMTGSLIVDATVTKVGLRMRNTALANTGLKGSLRLDKGRDFNFELNTPKGQEVDLIEASSKFYSLHGDREKWKQVKNRDTRDKFKTCTGKRMSALSGLELCVESHCPIPALKSNYAEYLLNGPAKVRATLYKKDDHNGYRLSAKLSQGKKNGLFHAKFDTPGSKVNRKVEFNSTLNYPKRQMAAVLSLPWRDITLNVTTATRRGLHLATGRIMMNETGDLYACSAEVRISSSSLKTKLRPKFALSMPGRKDISLEGTVSIFGNFPLPKSAHIDLSLSGMGRTPTTLKGKVINTLQEKTVKLDLVYRRRLYSFHWLNQMTNYPIRGVTINSMVDILTSRRRYLRMVNWLNFKKWETLKFRTHVEVYKLLNKFQLHVSLSRSVKQYRSAYDVEIWFKSLALSAKLKGELRTLSQKLITSKLELSYWIQEVTNNHIQLKMRFQTKSKGYHHIKWALTSAFRVKSNPEYDLDLTIGLGLQQRQDDLHLRVQYANDPEDLINFNIEVKKQIRDFRKAALSYTTTLHIHALELDVTLSGKHHHTTKMLDTSLLFHRGVHRNMAVTLKLENNSRRLKKYKGGVQIFWQDKEYSLVTEYDQKTVKLLVHRLTLTRQGIMTYDLLTQVETPKYKMSTMKTQIFAESFGRVTVSTSFLAHGRRLFLSGVGTPSRTLEVYGFKIDATIPRTSVAIKVNSEMFYPGRRITLKMTGANRPEKQGGQLEINLNADKKSCDERCMINVKSLIIRKTTGETERVWTKLDISLPFKSLTKLGLYTMHAVNSSQHYADAMMYWGPQKRRKITGALKIKNPIGWDSILADCLIKTPFTVYQLVEIKVSHKLSPELVSLINTISGFTVEKTLTTRNYNSIWQRGSARDFKMSSELDSNTRYFSKKIAMNIEHSSDDERIKSSCIFIYDKERFSCDVKAHASVSNGTLSAQSTGDLLLQTPANSLSAKWDHQNTLNESNSSLESAWNNDKIILILHGTQQGLKHPEASRKFINSSLIFESTSTSWHNFTLILDHEQELTSLNNNIRVVNGTINRTQFDSHRENDILALSNLQAKWGNNSAEANYSLDVLTWSTPITTSAKYNYTTLPYIGDVVVNRSPNETVSTRGSIDSLRWEDFTMKAKTESTIPEIPNSTVALVGFWLNDTRVFQVEQRSVFDYGNNKNIVLNTAVMSSYNGSEADICFSSPFEEHKDVRIHSFLNGADLRSIRALTDVTIEDTFKVSADFNLDTVDLTDVRLSGIISTPHTTSHWQPLSNFTISHKSSESNKDFETNAVLEYKAQTIALHNIASLADVNNISYSILLKTPIQDISKVGTGISYQRTPTDFIVKASTEIGSYIQFDSNMERKDSYDGKIFRSFWNITSPSRGGVVNDLALVRNRQGTEFKWALKTPFENFRDVSVYGASLGRPREYFNITGGFRLPLVGINTSELSFYHSKTDRRVLAFTMIDAGNFNFGSDLDVSYQMHDLHTAASMYQGDDKIRVFAKYKKVPPRKGQAENFPAASDLKISTPSYTSFDSSSSSNSETPTSSWLQLMFGRKPKVTTATAPTLPPQPSQYTGNLHDLGALVDLGQGNIYKMNSELDLRSQPIRFLVAMTSPIEDFQHLTLNVIHQGKNLSSFQTFTSINSSTTGALSASASSNVKSYTDFSAEGMLKADKLLPEDMNDWRLKIMTLSDAERTKCGAYLQWVTNKEIALNALIQKQPTWYTTRHILHANLSSPFETFRETVIHAEYSLRPNLTSERISEVNFSMKQDKRADLDFRYQNLGSRLVTLKVRRPCAAHLIGECLTLPQDGGRLLNLSWQGPLPHFNKRRVRGELYIDTTGTKPFTGLVAATFADDLNKTLTFTSRMINHAPRGSCCNHSFSLDLKRPSNNLDLGAVYNVYWKPEQLGTNVKVTYMGENELEEVAHLSGKFDKLTHYLTVSEKSRSNGLQLSADIQNGLTLRKYARQGPSHSDPLLEFPPRNLPHLRTFIVTKNASPLSEISNEMRNISEELVTDYCEIKNRVTSEVLSIWSHQVGSSAAHHSNLDSLKQPRKQEISLDDSQSWTGRQLQPLPSEQKFTSSEQKGSDDSSNRWWFLP